MPLYDSGEVAGLQYYIMPFATGESLRDRLAREGRLPLSVAVRLGIEIADALAYAHQRGVIHRDVKPANILSDAGHYLLADFGIAAISRRPVTTAGTGADRTGQGSFIGTLEYMAPEQILGEAVDGRADLYALASVVFEAISGRLPFVADSPRRLAQGKLSGAHASLDQLAPGTPSGLSQLIDRALAAEPDQRPGSVAEFQAALEVFRVPTGVPLARRQSASLLARRSLWLGVALLVVVAGALWWLANSPRLDSRRVVVAGFTNETTKPGLVVFRRPDRDLDYRQSLTPGNDPGHHLRGGVADPSTAGPWRSRDVAGTDRGGRARDPRRHRGGRIVLRTRGSARGVRRGDRCEER
jgi:serine/threonine-protein kinase